VNVHELEHTDPKKVWRATAAKKKVFEWRNDKEAKGKFYWTICQYGTPDSAKEAGLSEKAYWNEIINACFLDRKDPVAEWKKLYKSISAYEKKMTAITQKTEKFHIEGEDADLWITPGKKRRWVYGQGTNVPTFEIFTSPDWRGTEGWMYSNQPLFATFAAGQRIEGAYFEFKKGRVVKATAKKGDKVLKTLVAQKNGDKIGEYSLTDARFSRIKKFMGNTLFDENVGGKYGNTHFALGDSYDEPYDGDASKLTKAQREKLGFNESSVHTDFVSTSNRTVTAHLFNGTQKVVYKDGKFVL